MYPSFIPSNDVEVVCGESVDWGVGVKAGGLPPLSTFPDKGSDSWSMINIFFLDVSCLSFDTFERCGPNEGDSEGQKQVQEEEGDRERERGRRRKKREKDWEMKDGRKEGKLIEIWNE